MKKNNQLSIVILMVFMLLSHLNGSVIAQDKIVTKVNSSDGRILVLDPNLDKIWKSGFKYAIVIPESASIKSYCEVMNTLKQGSVYKTSNTIVFCTHADEIRAKEIAGSYTIFLSGSLPPKGVQEIGFYSVRKEKQGEYDYLFEKTSF